MKLHYEAGSRMESSKSGQKSVLDIMEKKLAQKLSTMRNEGKALNANAILM